VGIFHFAGLGKSPGAVTSGLAYLKHEYAQQYKDIYGDIIEGIVLFTSPEVASGNEKSMPSEHNDYMTINVRKTWPRNKHNTLEIVTYFVKKEIGDIDIYCCKVDVNNFPACFEAVAKATLRFHPPREEGKHIWANITGGANPLNAALFQVAYLSGFINRLYYTFISNPSEQGKYLQPFSRDPSQFEFREIYVLKTLFDERYQRILEELESIHQEDPSRWITSEELFGRLRSQPVPGFETMDPQSLSPRLPPRDAGARHPAKEQRGCHPAGSRGRARYPAHPPIGLRASPAGEDFFEKGANPAADRRSDREIPNPSVMRDTAPVSVRLLSASDFSSMGPCVPQGARLPSSSF